MKSDRLIAILLSLQREGKRSATELADELEVCVRTIYRDVDALSAAGVPIAAERGSQGGIVLADSYRNALARFDDEELRGLFVSSDDALAELGLAVKRRRALEKLAKALPSRERASLRATRGRVHVDSRRWVSVGSPTSALMALREAVWSDRRVRLAYTDRNGKATRRTLDPFGLVTKAGVWYLVARDGETIKTFRVQRMSHVRVLEARFTRPSTFDLSEYWTQVGLSPAMDEGRYVGVFEMSRHALSTVSLYFPVESYMRVRGVKPAHWTVRVVFPSLDVAVHEALGWDAGAVAVGPPELRRRLAERAATLAQRYTG